MKKYLKYLFFIIIGLAAAPTLISVFFASLFALGILTNLFLSRNDITEAQLSESPFLGGTAVFQSDIAYHLNKFPSSNGFDRNNAFGIESKAELSLSTRPLRNGKIQGLTAADSFALYNPAVWQETLPDRSFRVVAAHCYFPFNDGPSETLILEDSFGRKSTLPAWELVSCLRDARDASAGKPLSENSCLATFSEPINLDHIRRGERKRCDEARAQIQPK